MLIIFAAIASVLALVWIVLLMKVDMEDWKLAAFNQILSNRDEIEKLQQKEERNKKILSEYTGVSYKLMRQIYEDDFSKKINKLNKQNDKLQHGNLSDINFLVMPGYVLQGMIPDFYQSWVFKKIVQNYMELNGRKYAVQRAKHLASKLLSYPVIGIAAAMVLGIVFSLLYDAQKGMIFGGVALLLVAILTYAQYDDVKSRLDKRRHAISRQFPNVVSKLALLVTSGMIMEKAWKETAYSQDDELYFEMRKTSDELDNLIAPEAAYTNFINRCNTKETAKLASAIIQNLTKGNAEIGHLLKELATEAWAERQHSARKDGEKANSMLMIPTMLLFVSILVMILVPALTNMNI